MGTTKSIIIFLMLFFLILSGLFYWLQIRPANIRQQCEAEVKSKVEGKDIFVNTINDIYRICLVRHGMKAEDLVK